MAEFKDKMAFYATTQRDACRIARAICQEREIILLSERVLPKKGAEEDHNDVRYFIFVVLHEVAHAVLKHCSPLYNRLSDKEAAAQEKKADELALSWFNAHVESRKNPYLKPLTYKEIQKAKKNNQQLMKKAYEGI